MNKELFLFFYSNERDEMQQKAAGFLEIVTLRIMTDFQSWQKRMTLWTIVK
jgi:hypothetical protein